MSEEGGGFSKEEAFNRVLPEFRKKKDPSEQAKVDTDATIRSIIGSTSNRFGVPLIDQVKLKFFIMMSYRYKNQIQKQIKQFWRKSSR